MPFSAFAYVLFGVFTIVSTGLNIESQTRRVPVVLAAAAVVNLVLNLLLVPILGFLGSAIATLVELRRARRCGGYRVAALLRRAVGGTSRCCTLGRRDGLGRSRTRRPRPGLWRLICVAAFPALMVGLRIVPPRLLGPAIARIRPR